MFQIFRYMLEVWATFGRQFLKVTGDLLTLKIGLFFLHKRILFQTALFLLAEIPFYYTVRGVYVQFDFPIYRRKV